MVKFKYLIALGITLFLLAPLSVFAQGDEGFAAAYVNMLWVANEYEGFKEAVADAQNKIAENQTED
jgi:hypothetical protein